MMENLTLGNNGLIMWHIGCTHGVERQLEVPVCHVLLHSGDYSNHRDLVKNEVESNKFRDWLSELKIPFKLITVGNHCTWEEKNWRYAKDKFKEVGAVLLNDEHYEVWGLKFFFSGYSPAFGNWAWQIDRQKSYQRYSGLIDDDVNVVVTHGPRKGVLDLTESIGGAGLIQVGDSGLGTRLDELKDLRLHCFSHIHSSKKIENTGVLIRNGVYYSNASVVRDGQMGVKYFNGNLFNI